MRSFSRLSEERRSRENPVHLPVRLGRTIEIRNARSIRAALIVISPRLSLYIHRAHHAFFQLR
jgi:hypothetical protein